MKLQRFEEFLNERERERSGSIEIPDSIDVRVLFDLVYYLFPDCKVTKDSTETAVFVNGENTSLVFLEVIDNFDTAENKMKHVFLVSGDLDKIPVEFIVPTNGKKNKYATELKDESYSDIRVYDYRINQNEFRYLSYIPADDVALGDGKWHRMNVKLISSEKLSYITVEEIKDTEGYKEMLRAGFVDVSNSKSLAKLNFTFGFPTYLTHGKKLTSEKENVLSVPTKYLDYANTFFHSTELWLSQKT
jgi:hypothetical protein